MKYFVVTFFFPIGEKNVTTKYLKQLDFTVLKIQMS